MDLKLTAGILGLFFMGSGILKATALMRKYNKS